MRCIELSIAISVSLAACGSGGGFVDAALVKPTGSGMFSLTWSVGSPGGQSETCTQATATVVRLTFVDVATGSEYAGTFSCDLGLGVSGALFVATYNIDFDLSGLDGTLAVAPRQNALILEGKTTELQPVAFVTM